MPHRTKRVSIRCSPEEHAAWWAASVEEETSLEEWMRRAADQRLIDNPPALDPDGKGANVLRALIARYQALLRIIENKGELGIIGAFGCLGICRELAHHHAWLTSLPGIL